MTTSRGQFDDKTKTETVIKILSGEMSIQEAMAKFKLQSYQLHAWIGYVVMEQATASRTVPSEIIRRMAESSASAMAHLASQPSTTMVPLADQKAIVEWYIRNVVLSGTGTTV